MRSSRANKRGLLLGLEPNCVYCNLFLWASKNYRYYVWYLPPQKRKLQTNVAPSTCRWKPWSIIYIFHFYRKDKKINCLNLLTSFHLFSCHKMLCFCQMEPNWVSFLKPNNFLHDWLKVRWKLIYSRRVNKKYSQSKNKILWQSKSNYQHWLWKCAFLRNHTILGILSYLAS